MPYHPTGENVEIVGIKGTSNGQRCENHDCCGLCIVKEDVVLRLKKCQIIAVDTEKEETAIEAVWVSDGIDSCRVGFLPQHYTKHWKKYDGVLAQVIKVYDKTNDSPAKRKKYHQNVGCAVAALISIPPDSQAPPPPPTTTVANTKRSLSSGMPPFIVQSPRSLNNKPRTTEKQPTHNNTTNEKGNSCEKQCN